MNRNGFRAVVALGALVVLAGVGTAIYLASPRSNPPTTDAPAAATPKEPQFDGAWDSKLTRGKDPVSGTISIALSGRLVVSGLGVGPEPLQGDLTVDVYDLKPLEGTTDPRLLEEWLIQSEHLAAFGKWEPEGFVLTLNLPWSTYRPDIAAVKMAVKFKPAQGAELKREENVTLDHTPVQPVAAESGQ